MPQIRKLSPSVEIALPRRTSAKAYRGFQGAVVERRLADYPPPTPQPTPCRLWQGAADNHGYGTFHRYDAKTRGRDKVRPHRWVMEQIHGPLSPDQVVMHLCDNPLCYRVSHLRIGTIADNNADMKAKGRLVPRQSSLTSNVTTASGSGKARYRVKKAISAGRVVPEPLIDQRIAEARDELIRKIYATGIAPEAIAWMLDVSYTHVVRPALRDVPPVTYRDWRNGFPQLRPARGGSGRLPPERTSPVKSKEKDDVPRRTTVPQRDDDEDVGST